MTKILSAILIAFLITVQAEPVIAEGYLEFFGKALSNERPVAGATVTLYLTGTTGAQISSLRTGSDGKFSFDLKYDKMYRIILEKQGYTQMTILVNGFVPAAEKGYIMSYEISFDIFKHKEGYDTKMAKPSLIKIAYIARKENFGLSKPYSNSASYVLIEESEKPITVKDNIKEVDKAEVDEAQSDDEIVVSEEPKTEEEEQFLKDTEDQVKSAEFKEEIAEAAAKDSHAVEVATKRLVQSIEQKRTEDLKASKLKESLAREREEARKDVIKNRSSRSSSQKSLMMEIAEMMRDEKQKKP